jgi:hypothetical protein
VKGGHLNIDGQMTLGEAVKKYFGRQTQHGNGKSPVVCLEELTLVFLGLVRKLDEEELSCQSPIAIVVLGLLPDLWCHMGS